MPVINDIKLGPDPSGHFQIGHLYYELLMCSYRSVVEEEYQSPSLNAVEFISAFIFLGAVQDCEEGCDRPYVFKGCLRKGFHQSPYDTQILTFRAFEDAEQHMQQLEVIAKRYLEILEARREKQRNREPEE